MEGAIDYFKAAVNYYRPLSARKDSIDIAECEEMSAQGIDAYFEDASSITNTGAVEHHINNLVFDARLRAS